MPDPNDPYSTYDSSYDLEHDSSDVFDNRECTEGTEPSDQTFASAGDILKDRFDDTAEKIEDFFEDIPENDQPAPSYNQHIPDTIDKAIIENQQEIDRLTELLNKTDKEDVGKISLLKQQIELLQRQNENLKMLPFYEKTTGNAFTNAFRKVVRKIVYTVDPSKKHAEWRINPIAKSEYAHNKVDYLNARAQMHAANSYQELRAQDARNLHKDEIPLSTTEDLDKALASTNTKNKEKQQELDLSKQEDMTYGER